jgi:hypothetical protein
MIHTTNGVEIARIEITKTLTEDDTQVWVSAADSDGTDLPLVEALGMMRLAEDTLIQTRMNRDDDAPEDSDE